MSKCPKCGKPVYFAERRTSLGKDWHPACLRCDNCNSRLTPGRHSEHLKKPYCNGCYQQLFGPEGYRPGCVEPRKVRMNDDEQTASEKQDILARIKEYNLYKETPLDQMKYREVNHRVLFEGVLKIYWGLKNPIVLAPGAAYAKQRNNRQSIYDFVGVDDGAYLMMLEEASKARKRRELLDSEKKKLREIAENSVVNSGSFTESLSQDSGTDLVASLPIYRPPLEPSYSYDASSSSVDHSNEVDGSAMSHSLDRRILRDRDRSNSVMVRKRSASFRKISRQKRKEEAQDDKKIDKHMFTPPYGSSTNLRLSSTIRTQDVVQMLLSKYKAENDPALYGLFVSYDSGAQEPISDTDCPLMARLKLGPSEDIAKLYIMEKSDARAAQISAEVAEWIKFSLTELELFCRKYDEEEKKENDKVIQRFLPWKDMIWQRLHELEKTKVCGGTPNGSKPVYVETDV